MTASATQQLYDLSGRTALITGGATGLGEGFARTLAGAGATVVIGDIDEATGKETAKSIDGAYFMNLDVTQDDSWEAAVANTVDETGRLDILVNNAGIELTKLAIDADPDELRRMFDVNVVGTALGIKHAFRAMGPQGPAENNGGTIINISSVSANIAFPSISGYSASKSAVDRLTRVAAMEAGKLGLGVRVNCIYPGLVPNAMGAKLAQDVADLGLFESPEAAVAAVSELTPLGRLGDGQEMADALTFLASDASRFVTGAGLPVDGGMGM